MKRAMIFDLGFHTGEDTDFYLKKGFWVVAVDANPLLVERGRLQFKEYIDSRRLELLSVGIGTSKETLPFYVNKEKSEWSSFDQKIGTTRGDYYVIDVPLVRLSDLIDKYGVPYYVKIDIEGHDFKAIQSLQGLDELPKFISIENGQEHMIDELCNLGYTRFQFINQANITDIKLEPPAKEGNFVDHQFPFGSSGPFGKELEDEWLDRQSVLEISKKYWDNPNRDANVDGWYDLHATY